MKTLILPSLLLAGIAVAGDKDERRVPLDEVTIKSKAYKAEATLSPKEDGDLILNMQMNGKPVGAEKNPGKAEGGQDRVRCLLHRNAHRRADRRSPLE